MTRFKVEVVIECPSDWNKSKAASYVTDLLLSSESEVDTLIVTPISGHEPTKAVPGAEEQI